MRNIKLTIQFDGTNYNGWQIQKTEVRSRKTEVRKKTTTIQGTLQDAIKKITNEDVKVIGASRTDAGVHAISQIASFKTSTRLSSEIIKRALNANLPDDIRILDAKDAEENFHPRYDAKSKIYFYIISDFNISPFFYRYVGRVQKKLNYDEMIDASVFLNGRHDFSAFRGSGCGAKNTVRTILRLSIEQLDGIDFMTTKVPGNFLKIRIEADAFLRHMARNIVGTLIEVGKGRFKSEAMQGILLSRNRMLAGPTAPASGLFLERVNY
ncbi:MAG: tRNA pseudouridine(38-40) synthase TruA [Thermodesulfovibrionales bacterium]|nr:tRNA pseudouridine(38-40) synthase TruA [Thermodesulfovibrionales bacterium]